MPSDPILIDILAQLEILSGFVSRLCEHMDAQPRYGSDGPVYFKRRCTRCDNDFRSRRPYARLCSTCTSRAHAFPKRRTAT